MGVKLHNDLYQFDCSDPMGVWDAARAHGWPVDWLGKPNSFTCLLGFEPGMGHVILDGDQQSKIDKNQFYQLDFEHAAVGEGTKTVTLKGLLIRRTTCITPGVPDDYAAAHLVELVDRRALLVGRPINAGYNVRRDPGGAYYPGTMNGASAWTWATMVQNIWEAIGVGTGAGTDAATGLGAFPGLPFTPDGAPEGFEFYGTTGFEALKAVLYKLSCTLKFNPLTNAFSIVALAGGAASAGDAVWNIYPSEGSRMRVPGNVRVHFPRQSGGSEYPLAGTPSYYTVDVAGSGPDTTTYLSLHDDLPAVYDSGGSLTNSAALADRADEVAENFLAKVDGFDTVACIIGAGPQSLTTGSVLGVSWYDRGTGYKTEAFRKPIDISTRPPAEKFVESIWGKIDFGTNPYSWTEQSLSTDGEFADAAGGRAGGAPFVRSGTISSGSAVITDFSDTRGIVAGQAVSGTDIPGGATVASVDNGTDITISAPATDSGGRSITFGGFYPAYEVNGNETLLPDTIVRLWRGYLNSGAVKQEWLCEYCCEPEPWCATFGAAAGLEACPRDPGASGHGDNWCATFGAFASLDVCFADVPGSSSGGGYLSGSGSPASGGGTPAAVGSRYFDTTNYRNYYKWGAADTEWTLISGDLYDMLGPNVYSRLATTGAASWSSTSTYVWNTLGGSTYTVDLPTASDTVHLGVQALSTLSGIVTLDGNSTEEIRGSGGSGTPTRTYPMVANESLVIQGDGSHWRTTMEVMANFFFRASKDDAQTIPDTTATKVQFDDEEWDRGAGGCYDAAVNYRYTPLAPGIYRFSAQVALDDLADGSYGRLMLYKSGSLHRVLDQKWNGAVGDMVLSGSCTVSMNGSTDYVEIYVEHNHGGDCSTTADDRENNFEGERLCRWES
jgi:hypothetical protein